MLTFAFMHHPYLVCILFGMPSLHLFTFLMFFIFLFLYFFDVCLYVDLCFHASSLPCLHTFWHAIPTSFYIFNVFYFLVTNGLGLITRDSGDTFWIGYDQSHRLTVNPYCPFDYCVNDKVVFPLTSTDIQCAYNRSGLLCAACKNSQCNNSLACNSYLMLISATARAKKSILSSVQVTTTPELETALIV